MKSPVIFDIETGPEDADTLALFEPEFSAPANYKDPAKIEAKIAEQRDAWAQSAALHATTGRVLALGYTEDGNDVTILTEDQPGGEAQLIKKFWKLACPSGAWRTLIGFNSNRFDLPFLVRRAIKLGVRPPHGLLKGRYLHPCFIDLMDQWRCGDWQASISLDNLAKHLGLEPKTGTGDQFARLYESDRPAALDYLRRDVELTAEVAFRMGVVKPTTSHTDY